MCSNHPGRTLLISLSRSILPRRATLPTVPSWKSNWGNFDSLNAGRSELRRCQNHLRYRRFIRLLVGPEQRRRILPAARLRLKSQRSHGLLAAARRLQNVGRQDRLRGVTVE